MNQFTPRPKPKFSWLVVWLIVAAVLIVGLLFLAFHLTKS